MPAVPERSPPAYLQVAVPAPLSQLFDYLPPRDLSGSFLPGARVLVPFGRSNKVGVIVSTNRAPTVASNKLKRATRLLDTEPTVPPPVLQLAQWAAGYYAYPLGEVINAVLPPPARVARPLPSAYPERWRAVAGVDPEALCRAPVQARVLDILLQSEPNAGAEDLKCAGAGWRRGLSQLVAKGFAETCTELPAQPALAVSSTALPPTHEQHKAIDQLTDSLHSFGVFLLEGVTGSGKTEVYLQTMQTVIAGGRQVLLLVPEIGLTPQLVERVTQRFNCPVAVLHSGLSDGERYRAWCEARDRRAGIVLGTRSAVFAPMPELGLIVVDEEHDGSFKQQEGFRYHARDLAIVRAQKAGVPVVLGSATPSLETLANARRDRYSHLQMDERAGGAAFPELKLVDLQRRPLQEGLSEPLLEAMDRHLAAGDQVLVFINRRGYSPTLFCPACGWAAECSRCDSHLTLHRRHQRLQCHHCGFSQPPPAHCPNCSSDALLPMGEGTERIEAALTERYPAIPVLRIDRDSMRGREKLGNTLAQIAAGEPCIAVGTQMIAKGHHFPHVTLVGVINADRGLYSVDFRATEHLAQLIVQVAGRAGRASKPGEVLIQTFNPQHPLLQVLLESGYRGFSDAALEQRQAAGLPPFSRMALLRAEAGNARYAPEFLASLRERFTDQAARHGVHLLGPAPAPLERVAGRFRHQLLLLGNSRKKLLALCKELRSELEHDRASRRVRWSLDVDPADSW